MHDDDTDDDDIDHDKFSVHPYNLKMDSAFAVLKH